MTLILAERWYWPESPPQLLTSIYIYWYSIFKYIYYCVHIIFSWLSQNFWMVVCSSGASSPWRPELPKERKSRDRSHISNCSWIEQIYKYFRSVHTFFNLRQILYILRDQLRLRQYLEIRHARESTDASKEIPSTPPPSVMDNQRLRIQRSSFLPDERLRNMWKNGPRTWRKPPRIWTFWIRN